MLSRYSAQDFYTFSSDTESQKDYDARWAALRSAFLQRYTQAPELFCSVPGRIEIIGNHLDHARASVVAAGVTLDIRACARRCDDGRVQYASVERGDALSLTLGEGLAARHGENASVALMRGVCEWFVDKGYAIGGMTLVMHSTIPSGMGLSSSAAFSTCIAFILSKLYNNGALSPMELCICAQYAESIHMGKPCGLLDQIATVYGGLNHISFESELPVVQALNTSLADMVWIISTYGKGHLDTTAEYAAITNEMRGVARIIGAEALGLHADLRSDDPAVWKKVFTEAVIQKIQEDYSPRALLRAMHFVQERARVAAFVEAAKAKDYAAMQQLIRKSGESSLTLLQNVSGSDGNYDYALLLAAARQTDEHLGTASRVHGGGFGGSVISLVPRHLSKDFVAMLASYCPRADSQIVQIRMAGATEIVWQNAAVQ